MQRARTKITKSVVDRLQQGQTVWDSDIRGFGIRRQVWDKTFILKTSQGGRRRYITIGTFGSPWTVEQARKEALRVLADLVSGGSAALASTNSIRFSELCTRYISEHAEKHKKTSSANSDKRNIHNHLLPLLGSHLVCAITRADVEGVRNAIQSGMTACKDPVAQKKTNRGGKVVVGGKGVANRCLTLLSKMFNLAEDWEIRPPNSNPVRKVAHFREIARQRYLRSEELQRVGRALTLLEAECKIEACSAAAIRLLILTGARRGEILGLEWRHVDFHGRKLVLTDSKTGHKVIHLSKAALAILDSLPRVAECEFVLPGKSLRKPLVNISKSWRRVCQAAGIDPARIHDLRHTFASVGVSENVSLHTIGTLLTHASPATTARYAHLQSDHVSAANEQISSVLVRWLQGQTETAGRIRNKGHKSSS